MEQQDSSAPSAPFFTARQAQLEAHIARWRDLAPERLSVEYVLAYSGHRVYALTLTSPRPGPKVPLYFSQPHAHEPGTTAGMVDVIEQLVTGRDVLGAPATFDVEQALDRLILTFNPIGNVQGREAAPVDYWDGSRYTNEQFWCWMRGEDPQHPGQMWKRLDVWDSREHPDAPKRVGIVYEQVDQYRWVEPNRSQLSSYFRLFRRLDDLYHYQMWLQLHQTEFVGSPYTCEALLPMEGLAKEPYASHDLVWGQRVVRRWLEAGYAARPEPRPSRFDAQQAQYFRENMGPIHARMSALTTEVKNNAPDATPLFQLKAQTVAILASIEQALEG